MQSLNSNNNKEIKNGNYITSKYAIIGASQSGKTTWVRDKLVAGSDYKFIIICGQEYNYNDYKEVKPKGSKITYYGLSNSAVLTNLTTLLKTLDSVLMDNPKTKLKRTLIIFDDFVDTKALSDDRFRTFMAVSRHYNISIAYLCHSPSVVLDPFMKAQISIYIICQYQDSHNFSEFFGTFLDPILSDQMTHSSKKLATKDSLRLLRNKVLYEAFSGRFGKLIIDVCNRRYAIVKPAVKFQDINVISNESTILREAH